MSEEKTIISIVKNQGSPTQEIIDIRTNGYLCFYLEHDKIKTSGDIELAALAPVFMQVAMSKIRSQFGGEQ